jgi:hypothetical protein
MAPLIPNLGANLRRVLNFAISKIYWLKRPPERTEQEVGWGSDSFWNFSRIKLFYFCRDSNPCWSSTQSSYCTDYASHA